MQFLQHDGYIETARAFAEDLRIQNEALRSTSNSKSSISLRDDEDANNRQRIRRAVLDGDIDLALDYMRTFYPHVLEENHPVAFKLKCRKFIELVRKAAQLNTEAEARGQNGNSSSNGATATMDIDANGFNGLKPPELQDLEISMLIYGQELQREYAGDPRPEITAALEQIWALVAYPNPLKEPEVAHLLDRKGRQAVAEELNSAILCKNKHKNTMMLRSIANTVTQRLWVNHHRQHWRKSMHRRLCFWKSCARMAAKGHFYRLRMYWRAFLRPRARSSAANLGSWWTCSPRIPFFPTPRHPNQNQHPHQTQPYQTQPHQNDERQGSRRAAQRASRG